MALWAVARREEQMCGLFEAFRSQRYHRPQRRHLSHWKALARSTFLAILFPLVALSFTLGGDYRCDGRSGPCVTLEPS